MTGAEIKRRNLIKMGMKCLCGKIYGIDHPVGSWIDPPVTDPCEPSTIRLKYTYRWAHTLRHYNHFKLRGEWYWVKSPLVETFLSMAEIDEAFIGSMGFPIPILISRQVDIFTTAERLKITPPLNDYQQKRAKTKAFIERIKK